MDLIENSLLLKNKLPNSFLEIFNHQSGICVVAGDVHSRVDQTLIEIQNNYKFRQFVKYNSQVPPQKHEALVFDPIINKFNFQALVQHSESGHLCLVMMRAPSVMTALRQFLSFELGEGRQHWVLRFSEQLKVIAYEKQITNMQKQEVTAREILLLSSEHRDSLGCENIAKISELMRAESSTLGTVSLNQNLLQLVLRRQLDVSSAFRASHDPAELDAMMKKVGF